MRLLALTRYGRTAASTRQRVLQFLPLLRDAGISVDVAPLLDDEHVERMAAGRRSGLTSILPAFLRRLSVIRAAKTYDAIWVYGETFPYLPSLVEQLPALFGRPVIYDLDDAFFHRYDQHPNPLVRAALGRKLKGLLTRSACCFCGNSYLLNYVSRFAPHAVLMPTVVDTMVYRPTGGRRLEGLPVVGWIGSPSTYRYLREIMPLLVELAAADRIRVRIVGAGPEAEKHRSNNVELVDWREEDEVAEIAAMDIGVMPAVDEPWALGKCGYKLIQYGACGLPVVATPIGAACDILQPGQTGFFASTTEEWRDRLLTLAGDAELRRDLGQNGRDRIVADYSLARHGPRLVAEIEALRPSP